MKPVFFLGNKNMVGLGESVSPLTQLATPLRNNFITLKSSAHITVGAIVPGINLNLKYKLV